MYYLLESTAERRARKARDIKTLFHGQLLEEGFSFMDAYEAVGYLHDDGSRRCYLAVAASRSRGTSSLRMSPTKETSISSLPFSHNDQNLPKFVPLWESSKSLKKSSHKSFFPFFSCTFLMV